MTYRICSKCDNEVSDQISGNVVLNDRRFYCLDCVIRIANKSFIITKLTDGEQK